ncbi:MAG: transcriptional regulator [Hespellia sp.]|nr:transcriptional regulator [Hespellia sp.]
MVAAVQRSEVTVGYYGVEDVMTILGCQRTKAQEVIRTLNDELVAKGYMRWPKGKISKAYFNERFL